MKYNTIQYNRQPERQTEIWSFGDIQKHRHTERHTDKETTRQTHRKTDIHRQKARKHTVCMFLWCDGSASVSRCITSIWEETVVPPSNRCCLLHLLHLR